MYICTPMNAKKKSRNSREVPNLTKNSFVRADAPALAMTRTCPWNAEEHCYFEKKNTFTFTATAEVRCTLQTFFNI